MHHDFAGPPSFAFGRFSVLPARRELIADGRRIEVGDRAFDVLLVLLEASGTIVSKDDLLGRVWPTLQATTRALNLEEAGASHAALPSPQWSRNWLAIPRHRKPASPYLA
jgi:hypothetical protein